MSNNFHIEVLPEEQLQLFEILSSMTFISDFYLAGGTCSQKYGTGLSNQYHHLKSLVYFADAEEEAMPVMLKPLRWSDVKKHIISSARKFRI